MDGMEGCFLGSWRGYFCYILGGLYGGNGSFFIHSLIFGSRREGQYLRIKNHYYYFSYLVQCLASIWVFVLPLRFYPYHLIPIP